jgi:hypothetical protein
LCNEATAIWYLKTNGSAYFGGALSAGILKNAAQTTSLAADASVELEFGTNGNPKVVVVSYSATGLDFDSGSDVSANTGTATFVLERSLNSGGSWTQVGSPGTATASVFCVSNGGEPSLPAFSCGRVAVGSFTITDTNTTAISNFRYRVRLTARNLGWVPNSQALGFVSTEN